MERRHSPEEVLRERIISSLEEFLEGKKDLNWIKGILLASGILQRKGELQGIFDELRAYEDLPRYREILEECK